MAEFTVKVGGEDIAVPPRDALKGTKIIDAAMGITDRYPVVREKIAQERAVAEQAGLEVNPDAVWLAAIPTIYRVASDEIWKLLALILADHDTLLEKQLEAPALIDDYLRRESVVLLSRMTTDEMLPALDVVAKVIAGELEGKVEQALALYENVLKIIDSVAQNQTDDGSQDQSQVPTASSSSSTPSPAPMDGATNGSPEPGPTLPGVSSPESSETEQTTQNSNGDSTSDSSKHLDIAAPALMASEEAPTTAGRPS